MLYDVSTAPSKRERPDGKGSVGPRRDRETREVVAAATPVFANAPRKSTSATRVLLVVTRAEDGRNILVSRASMCVVCVIVVVFGIHADDALRVVSGRDVVQRYEFFTLVALVRPRRHVHANVDASEDVSSLGRRD